MPSAITPPRYITNEQRKSEDTSITEDDIQEVRSQFLWFNLQKRFKQIFKKKVLDPNFTFKIGIDLA